MHAETLATKTASTVFKLLRATDSSFSWACQRCSIFESCSSRWTRACRITWRLLNPYNFLAGLSVNLMRDDNCQPKTQKHRLMSPRPFSSSRPARPSDQVIKSVKLVVCQRDAAVLSQGTSSMASIFTLSCFRASASSLILQTAHSRGEGRDGHVHIYIYICVCVSLCVCVQHYMFHPSQSIAS